MQRTIARKAVDWASLAGKLSSESAKAELNRLRAVAGDITALSNTYASPPAAIDFAAYKAKIGAPGVVDKFAAEYGAVAYPTYVAEELAEIKAKHDALVADAQASVAESQERITVLSALVASMEANKVGPRTTLDQIYELYPDLQAEIEDEIDNHEWGKDIA